MKFQTFSVVVGNNACNASCPYCVSKNTAQVDLSSDLNLDRLDTAARLAEKCGVTTALITGKGEPTLYPEHITSSLQILYKYFPIIELQTNGLWLEKIKHHLDGWYRFGLTTICISVAHYLDAKNKKIFLDNKSEYPHLPKNIAIAKTSKFSVRLSVVGCKGYIDTPQEIDNLVKFSKACQVDQLTWRPVTFPSGYDNMNIRREYEIAQRMIDHIDQSVKRTAKKLLNLPHGGEVFDYQGQNLCLTNCLTHTNDPNDIRQLIYFPNGEIRYDWVYPGARIL
ncbi:radical SAM protein [Candidatus Pacearchaeota archaeon]|jgi:molybdenum cofactor biosynthesis enzyme MoaA|nr:radical SAM protein [bacterium]MCK9597043.1 radical SAM protein [Candidatus Pacearchaeota archaeon]